MDQVATRPAPQADDQLAGQPGGPSDLTVADHNEVRRSHGFHALRVKEVIQETQDTRSYALEVPEDLSETFRYEAGQFCTFRVRIGEDEHLRSYSMSSSPGIDPDLTVTVKRVPGGLVSNWFHDHVVEGTVLEVTRPAGVFCPSRRDSSVVAFCGGSGITPFMSITKSVLRDTSRSIKMLYANRDRDSVIFEKALGDLNAVHEERLHVRHHFDSEGGYLTPQDVTTFTESERDADFYICGPGPFMELVETRLLDLGVEPQNILIERFETSEVTPSLEGGAEGITEDTVTMASETPEFVTLILKGSPTTIPYRAGDTVLETARRAGLQPPFSCETGNCATCMALLRDGSATLRANNALTPEELDEGWILTCQALPHGSTVTVEYEAL